MDIHSKDLGIKMKLFEPQDFGYEGHEMLMHSFSGDVETAEDWASEAHKWGGVDEKGSLLEGDEMIQDIERQFSSYLFEVIKDENDEWIEIDFTKT